LFEVLEMVKEGIGKGIVTFGVWLGAGVIACARPEEAWYIAFMAFIATAVLWLFGD